MDCRGRYTDDPPIVRSQKKASPRDLFKLGYLDSNQEKQDQNLLCYHYTIAQERIIIKKSWATWIRTKKNRTRICCVTITP